MPRKPAIERDTPSRVERLGFRLEEIAPADDPAEALMTGHGLRLLLDRGYRVRVATNGRHRRSGGFLPQNCLVKGPTSVLRIRRFLLAGGS